ncbi:MAG: chemotaxis protein CheX [Gammaproteobacteria bacterium]|jgi:chemotaxis protein CheX|nr:chemotaxis protein CheX [Gammaproteobacteria bacterium]
MNTDFVNPFITATTNILSVMAQIDAKPGTPTVKDSNVSRGDVTGLIGMTGDKVKGSFSLSFSTAAIADIAEKMLGEKVTSVDETVIDLAGELVNMATGGAKQLLEEKEHRFDMATPVVVAGDDHLVVHQSSGPIIILPFTTEAGNFFIELSFEDIEK